MPPGWAPGCGCRSGSTRSTCSCRTSPGPKLYYGGARLEAYYPISAIADGQGLNITVTSYLDRMFFGLLACRELVPDVDKLAGYLEDELQLLLEAVGASSPSSPPPS